MSVPNILTKRLTIRNLKQSDTHSVFSIWGDIEMKKYLHYLYCENEDELYNSLQGIDDYLHYSFVVFLKDTKQLIGTCSIYPQDDINIWDIGYCVHKDFWKNGYGKEMVKALIAFAYDNGATIITAQVEQSNKASCALLKSCGFIIDSKNSSIKTNDGKIHPTYIYKLIPDKKVIRHQIKRR